MNRDMETDQMSCHPHRKSRAFCAAADPTPDAGAARPSCVEDPEHYHQAGSMEPLQIMDEWGILEEFLRGNILKYLCRYPHKGTPLEDALKLQEYARRLVALLEARRGVKE